MDYESEQANYTSQTIVNLSVFQSATLSTALKPFSNDRMKKLVTQMRLKWKAKEGTGPWTVIVCICVSIVVFSYELEIGPDIVRSLSVSDM